MNSFNGFYFLSSILFIIIWVGLLGLGIYSFILFIKLARRGIRALDIYINEKENERGQQ